MNNIKDNGLDPIIAQAIEETAVDAGNTFTMEKINLAEMERRTGV